MKIRRISELQGRLRFPNLDADYVELMAAFGKTELGEIYAAVPWLDLVKTFNLSDKNKGPRSIFSPRGKLGLMFLKHYAQCSDKRLIEQLNANVYYQIFCDVVIDPTEPIMNYKIVSEIRCELGLQLNIEKAQEVLAGYWKPYCENTTSMCCDATCYESYIRYPTDIKLLYETVKWNYDQLKQISKQVGQKLIRTKMNKWKKRYGSYSRSRRPSKKEKRALRRAFLKLLLKIDTALKALEQQVASSLSARHWKRRTTTVKILNQQWNYFYHDIKPKHRIVSLDKSYIRPIVRGKEVKSVEFGAKVNKIQIDGISFIEHISFEAFNEGARLKSSIWTAQKLMKNKIDLLGADGIYANNANRKYITKNTIKTDFKRKGRPSKHHDHYTQLAKMITKERASRLEGSFGTEKEHFLLNRIPARTEKTEALWIFFGIHTANALKIGRRMTQHQAIAA